MSLRPYRARTNYLPKTHRNHRKRPIKPIPYATIKRLHRLDFVAAQATLEGGECAATNDPDLADKIRECSCMRFGAVIALYEAGYTLTEIGVILKLSREAVIDTMRKLRAKGINLPSGNDPTKP